jgi:hypothetical protein
MLWRVFGGAALIVAGIAAFIEANAYRPVAAFVLPTEPTGAQRALERVEGPAVATPASGLSHTQYDLLHIGGWALLVFGVLLVIVGLIGYARRPATREVVLSALGHG